MQFTERQVCSYKSDHVCQRRESASSKDKGKKGNAPDIIAIQTNVAKRNKTLVMKSGRAWWSVKIPPASHVRCGYNAVNVTYGPMKLPLQGCLGGSVRIVTLTMTSRIGTIIIKAADLLCICIFPSFYTVLRRPNVYYCCSYAINYKLFYVKLESEVITVAAYSWDKTPSNRASYPTAGLRRPYDKTFKIMFHLIFRWKKCNSLSRCIPNIHKYPMPYWLIILIHYPKKCDWQYLIGASYLTLS